MRRERLVSHYKVESYSLSPVKFIRVEGEFDDYNRTDMRDCMMSAARKFLTKKVDAKVRIIKQTEPGFYKVISTIIVRSSR